MSNLYKQVLALAVVSAAAAIGNCAQAQVTIDQAKATTQGIAAIGSSVTCSSAGSSPVGIDAPSNLCNGAAC